MLYCWVLTVFYGFLLHVGMLVTLITDDGKYTLSGSYCPTTVKMLCNVTNGQYLLWTYNSGSKLDNFIVNFPPDDIARTFDPIRTNISAFPIVQLTQFNMKKKENQSQINASTILTADLLELYNQNIKLFSCSSGSSGTVIMPVNISILQPNFSCVISQVYTNVVVRYESGLVSNVDVSWRKFKVHTSYYFIDNNYACIIGNIDI